MGVALRASCVWRAPSHAVAPESPRAIASRSASSVERSSRSVFGVVRSGAGGNDERAFDIAGAREVERRLLEAVAHQRALNADAQRVRERAGRGAAVQRHVERAAVAALVLAAEVVEVEVAVRAIAVEVRRPAGPGAVAAAAERKRDPVVGAQPLREPVHDQPPVGVQPLREAKRCCRRIEHHRQRPRLVVEVDARVGNRRNRLAEHAEARNARLRPVAHLDFRLDERRHARAPVAGEGDDIAVARCVVDLGIEMLGAGVEANAERVAAAEALAQVDAADDAAALAPLDVRRAQRCVEGALHDHVDQAARRARSCLQPAQALQDVDACLVLERDRCLRVDRQAVAAEVEAVVDDEAAHGEVVDVALGVVCRRHRRIEAGQVGEASRTGVARLLGVDAGRRDRRLLERRVAPACDARRRRCPAGDRHRRECGRRGRCRRRGRRRSLRERRSAGERNADGERRAQPRASRGEGRRCSHRRSDGRALGRGVPEARRGLLPCARITSVRFKGTVSEPVSFSIVRAATTACGVRRRFVSERARRAPNAREWRQDASGEAISGCCSHFWSLIRPSGPLQTDLWPNR